MPVIALTTPLYTDTRALLNGLKTVWNLQVHTDRDILAKTAHDYQISESLLDRVVQVCPIAYNTFTHEREKALAGLGKTLSVLVGRSNCIFSGTVCHLLPNFVTHVFRILVMDDKESRIGHAIEIKGWTTQQAKKAVDKADQDMTRWIGALKKCSPWDASLYNMVVNLDAGHKDLPALQRIKDAASSPPYTGRTPRDVEVANLSVTTDVHMALAHLGPGLKVDADAGSVIVTIDRRRMNLSQTQARIMDAAGSVPGVGSVRMKIGPNYYRSQMIKTFDFGRSTGVVKWDTDEIKTPEAGLPDGKQASPK